MMSIKSGKSRKPIGRKAVDPNGASSIEDRVYDEIKKMSINYLPKPGQRVNEIEVANQLGVSRTPVRQALSRLNTEGFVVFQPGEGFYIRGLSQKEVVDLYELRKAIEFHAVKLSINQATDDEIVALQKFISGHGLQSTNRTAQELVNLDEEFHERLVALSRNQELVRIIRNVNERIRFFRSIGIESILPSQRQKSHEAIVAAISERNLDLALERLAAHMTRRLETAIRDGILHIYG